MKDTELTEETLSCERVWEGRVFDVECRRVLLPNGDTVRRDVVMHKGAVCVIALTENHRVLMERQWRSGYGGVTLEIPAGKLDSASEDPLDCAVRELAEETGLRAGRMTLLTSILTTPGFCTEQIAIYLAEGLTQGETHPDEDEFLGLVRMPLAEAVGLVMRGEIRDSKSICGLLMASAALGGQRA